MAVGLRPKTRLIRALCVALGVGVTSPTVAARADRTQEFGLFWPPLPSSLTFPPEMPGSVRTDLQRLLSLPHDVALQQHLRSLLDGRGFSQHIRLPLIHRRDGKV